jgi:hypothetical protein
VHPRGRHREVAVLVQRLASTASAVNWRPSSAPQSASASAIARDGE